ncbi:MAG: HlyD family efflux transporter periplasmic adaptor subunit [Eubacterium sp.]|nr:HlyD family efflux transporter periplasmic adaptor subunit [Eubacterium sp.]
MKEKRRKKKISKGKLIRIIITIVVVLALLSGGVVFLREKVSEKYGTKSESSVTSVTVEAGSISTTVYGSGQLSDDDVEEITVPDSVEIEELKASPGDAVSEGDILATVDTQSVITAMSEVQSEIDEMDEKLDDAKDDEVSSTIKAPVSGRVKEIFAESGDSVTAVMSDKNALMTISADGYMAVDIETASLSEGEEVTVKTSDDTEYSGKVRYVSGDTTTIVFSDNGPSPDDTVRVLDTDGNELATGKCYINSPITVVGYGGTVSSIKTSVNSYVYSGNSLITLTDTEYTVNYDTLLKERKKLEEELAELLNIYKKGAICASISGSIKTVADTDTGSSSSTEDEAKSFTISPDKTMTVAVAVDETDILSLEIGQEASITISSISEDTFTGTVKAINKTGTTSDGVTQYTAEIEIEKQDGMLEGMSAEASIKIKSVDDTLIMKADALNETSSSAYVYTTYDEEKDELGGMTEVTIGITNSNYVEIVSGLKEGDTVYYKEKTDSGRKNGNRPDFGSFGGDFSGFDSGSFSGPPGMGGSSSSGNPFGGGMPSMPGGN